MVGCSLTRTLPMQSSLTYSTISCPEKIDFQLPQRRKATMTQNDMTSFGTRRESLELGTGHAEWCRGKGIEQKAKEWKDETLIAEIEIGSKSHTAG